MVPPDGLVFAGIAPSSGRDFVRFGGPLIADQTGSHLSDDG
jgi:hypothetical protein